MSEPKEMKIKSTNNLNAPNYDSERVAVSSGMIVNVDPNKEKFRSAKNLDFVVPGSDVNHPSRRRSKGNLKMSQLNLKESLAAPKEKEPIARKKARKWINKILDSYYFIGFMMTITIYVLFISDIKAAFITREADEALNITQTVCFALFILEMVLASIAQKGYIFSFFFWLDFISTISLIQDIDFIFDPIIGNDSTSVVDNAQSKAATQAIAKATSAGRITRILRIVRIIRLIRIVKLYKTTMQTRQALAKKKKEKLLKKNKLMEEKRRQEMERKHSEEQNKQINNNVNFNKLDALKSETHLNSNNMNPQTPKDQIKENMVEMAPIKQDKKLSENIHKLNANLKNAASQPQSSKNLPYQLSVQNYPVEEDKEEENLEDIVKESNISKMLSESITKKLIILILGMILGLTVIREDMYLSSTPLYDNLLVDYIGKLYPQFNGNLTASSNFFAAEEYSHLTFFQTNFNGQINDTQKLGYISPIKLIEMANLDPTSDKAVLPFSTQPKVEANGYFHVYNSDETSISNNNSTLSYMIYRAASLGIDTVFPIINITLDGETIFVNNTIKDYPFRLNDVIVSVSTNERAIVYRSVFYDVWLTGILNICKTIFIMILIVAGAIAFENDTKTLVLDPLEIMIEIVEMVEKDPIIAKNAENLKTGVKNLMNNADLIDDNSKKKKNKHKKKIEENSEKYEVKMIQNSIVKISGLLAICFGEAGGDIIKQNLEKGKDFNPMLEGKKKQAIFGFCDIRQFPTVNDALQERTMIFVNQISEIVHSSIDRFSGATNKNIGDSYLSAWRFIKVHEYEDGQKHVHEVKVDKSNPDATFIADQSILGFLQIIIKINSDADVLAYRDDPLILAHPQLKNYKVKMGFGLHLGWGIEGAIGSNCKIDASYLSPNVNISARLKEATKQYGVLLLISGELYDLCSPPIKNICRLLDKVAVKGSINPIRLYTVDMNIHNFPKDTSKKSLSTKKRYEKLIKLKELIHLNGKKAGNLIQYVLGTKYFKRLLHLKRDIDFKPTFDKAIQAYLDGRWTESGELLQKCGEMDPNDGPTKTIYSYIQSRNFTVEKEGENAWKGYRALTSK